MKIKLNATHESILKELPHTNCKITCRNNEIEIENLSLAEETTFKDKIKDKVHNIE